MEPNNLNAGMRLSPGTLAPPIRLPAIDGSEFDSSQMRGKPYLLSFFRFATCPFCNLRMHELVSRYEELGQHVGVVAIFESPLDHLQQYAGRHHAPFPVLADPDKRYYRLYGIEQSLVGMLKGMLFKMPQMIKGMAKGYLPFPIKGRLTTMPADFLIDREGIIQFAHYGKDEGDHLPFEQVKAFARREAESKMLD